MGKPARARCLTSLEPVPSALDGRDETGLECRAVWILHAWLSEVSIFPGVAEGRCMEL